jgi:hypothetical protein
MEQQEALKRGEQINMETLIRDPDPYEDPEYHLVETEDEGQCLDEFLLSLKDFQSLGLAKFSKWKKTVRERMSNVTNASAVLKSYESQFEALSMFWVRTRENAASMVDSGDLAENPRLLEFTCKAYRRIMESGQVPLTEMSNLIDKNIELD